MKHVRPRGLRMTCPQCGRVFHARPWTERTIEVVEIGLPIPPYRGNQRLLSEKLEPPLGQDDSFYTAMDLVSETGRVSLVELSAYKGRRGRRIIRETWDGDRYYHASNPFCTQTCAAVYGMRAAQAGFVLEPQEKMKCQ